MTQVFNRDCMEAMKEFPDKFFELAIVDPPYGIEADKKNSVLKKQSNKSASFSKDYGDQEEFLKSKSFGGQTSLD